jgi:hypothetical protein
MHAGRQTDRKIDRYADITDKQTDITAITDKQTDITAITDKQTDITDMQT